MSQDLLTQLAEYGAYCNERQEPVSAEDVIDAIVPLPMPTPTPAPSRGWLVAVAAAALILVVIGGVAWLTSFDNSISPADDPTVTTVPETTVPQTTVPQTTVPGPPTTVPAPPTTVPGPSTTAPQAVESVIWTRHEGSVPGSGSSFYRETPVGLVAIRTEDFQVPLVYMSSNGSEWTEVPIPGAASVPLPEVHSFDVEPTPAGVWLTGPDGDIWFANLDSWSSGAPSWEEMASEADLLDLKGPPPVGTRWASGISGKARIGTTSLLAVDWELAIDYGAILDLPPGYTDIGHDDLDSCYSGGTPGQLSVRGRNSSGEEVCLTTVTMVNDAGGVSVLDEDGDQVVYVENAVAEFAYGDGGPHVFPPSGMLDLYASTDGRLELVRSVDATYPCGHGLDHGDGAVVHVIDCPDLEGSAAAQDVARSTTDGVTWEQIPYDDPAFLGGRHPLGFSWESTWPWGPPDDVQGPSAILVSEDGETWTELIRHAGPIFDPPAGIVATQVEADRLADEIFVYNGTALSTVQANWPMSDWPEFSGMIGNTLILIHGADVWIGELFAS